MKGSPMTNKLRKQLLAVLTDMERAQAYVASDSVAVCRYSAQATTTLHYTRAMVPAIDRSEPRPLMVMAKDIGSDLCRLPAAISALKACLESC